MKRLVFSVMALTSLPLLAQAAEAPPPSLKQSGAPVEARWIEVIPANFKLKSRTFDLAADQRSIVLTELPSGFALVCTGGKGMATSYQFSQIEAGSSLTFPELTPGVRVTGSVARGRKPAAGAEVGLVPYPVPLRRFFSFPLARKGGEFTYKVNSDSQGRYVLPHVAPGTYLLDVRFPGGRTLQGEPFTVPAPETLRGRQKPAPGEDAKKPPTLDLGETAIAEGLDLTVTAVDSAGQPIPGARLTASQGDRLGGKAQSFEGTANEAGTVMLSGLSPGEGVIVFCRAPGFVPWEQTLGGPPQTVRCTLERHTRLEGRVFDLEDQPLVEAHVSIKPHLDTVPADREGRFKIIGLGTGAHSLVVAAPGFRAFTTRIKLSAEQKLELPPIRLERAEAFTGRVVDGTTEEPVAGAVVTITDPPGAGGTMTDVEGGFSVKADTEGDLFISISSSAYPSATFAVSREDRQNREKTKTFELFPGGRIRAVAWNERADAPCSGCSVNLQWLNPQRVKFFQITTNENGEGQSDPLPPGDYSARIEMVVSTGTNIRVGGGGGQSQEVQVLSGKTTTVRLGEPRPVLEVSFAPPPSPETLLQVQAGGEGGGARLEADGVYRVRKRAGAGARLTLVTGRIGDLEVLHATLPEGFEKPYLRLPLPQTRVIGRLTRDREPVYLQKIQIVSQDQGAVLARGGADENGTFTAAYLPPGSYTLMVNDRSLRTFHLTEGQPLDLGVLEIPAPPAR